jgi:hypothetical protein
MADGKGYNVIMCISNESAEKEATGNVEKWHY